MKQQGLPKLGYPPYAWFLFFVLAPLGLVLVLSFLTRGIYGGFEWTFTTQAYERVFHSAYLNIFLRSLKLSLYTSISCLILAYPMAWSMATASEQARRFWVLALAIPFMTNLIIRVYAIKLFTGIGGPLQGFLNWAQIPFEPFAMSQNSFLVMYGMITTYLPFMVFPIFAALEKFDFSLVEAAQDLGASQLKILFGILIPNTIAAAVNGFTLVFIPCLGEFVIPDLLGGAKSMLIGNLITEQFLKSRDWPFGAALSIILILLLILIPFGLKRAFLRRKISE